MSAVRYIPHPLPSEDVESVTDDDVQFVEAFDDLAKLCESFGGNTEEFTLWLSTCRNERLTVNAIYQDILEAFSPTKKTGPLLDSILFFLRQLKPRHARRQIDLLKRDILPAMAAKIETWEDRAAFQSHLESYLGQCKIAERTRLKRLLYDVRSSEGDLQDKVSLVYWEEYLQLEVVSRAYLLPFWQAIYKAKIFLQGFGNLASKAIDVLRFAAPEIQPELFDQKNVVQQTWDALVAYLEEHAQELCIGCSCINSSIKITTPFTQQILEITTAVTDRSAILYNLECLWKTLEESILFIESELREVFRPLPKEAALPPPYLIDVRPPQSSKIVSSTVPTYTHKFGLSGSSSLKVMVIGGSSKHGIYRHREVDFGPGSIAEKVFKSLCFEALELAKSHGADALVLPEGFLPRVAEDEVCNKAREFGISLISGVEPGVNLQGRYENYGVFQDGKAGAPIRQYKAFPSGEEPEEINFRGAFNVLKDTSIGTCAMLLCSDIQNLPPISALAATCEPIEIIFVCSATSFPEVQHSIATADSARLHAYVVWTNNYPSTLVLGEELVCCQSLVFKPSKQNSESQIASKIEPVSLLSHKREAGFADMVNFKAKLFEIDLSSLAFDRPKPAASSMIARPPSRALE